MKVENALAHDFLNELLDDFKEFGWRQGLGYGQKHEACLILRMAPVRNQHAEEVVAIATSTMVIDSAFSGYNGSETERIIAFNDDPKTTWKEVEGMIERTKMRLRDTTELDIALQHPVWKQHALDTLYTAKGCKGLWKLAYYPIFCDGKTGESYTEPRALMEQQMTDGGTDFREMPLRYVQRHDGTKQSAST